MIVVGITDTMKHTFQAYLDWIRRGASSVELVPLSYQMSNIGDVQRCDGVVLTGGGDIHPKFYGREDAMSLVRGVNEQRDEFEFDVVRMAVERGLPILGICRGMQVVNVAQGGTMIPDVPTAGFENHSGPEGVTVDPCHDILVESGTRFQSIVSAKRGEVNTHHHQAVEKPGRHLRPTAYSTDGLIEGLEWEEAEKRPFFQLVQWHPERMKDFESPFSKGLLEHFLNAVEASKRTEASS